MVDCEGGFGFTESAEGEVYFHRNNMVEGEFDAIEPGSRGPPRGPRARERGGLAGNHGPPHWQASSAGETRLIRLRELCPATPDSWRSLRQASTPSPYTTSGDTTFSGLRGPGEVNSLSLGIPGLQRRLQGAESGFGTGVMAEGQVLSSNPLL